MSIAESLMPEIELEAAATRRLLERVPEDQLSWKPHEKSMPLGRLATHLAELPTWGVNAVKLDELDIMPPGAPPFVPTMLDSTSEIVELFDTNLKEMVDAIRATKDEAFSETWTLKAGGKDVFTQSRLSVIRMNLNHIIHHRGQLTVFLRLLDVALPGTYGPSADDNLGFE